MNRTEAALIATSTRNPADSSRTWPIARRERASGAAKNIDCEGILFPSWNRPSEVKTPAGARGSKCIGTFSGRGRSAALPAGKILLEPVDVVVAVDDRG